MVGMWDESEYSRVIGVSFRRIFCNFFDCFQSNRIFAAGGPTASTAVVTTATCAAIHHLHVIVRFLATVVHERVCVGCCGSARATGRSFSSAHISIVVRLGPRVEIVVCIGAVGAHRSCHRYRYLRLRWIEQTLNFSLKWRANQVILVVFKAGTRFDFFVVWRQRRWCLALCGWTDFQVLQIHQIDGIQLARSPAVAIIVRISRAQEPIVFWVPIEQMLFDCCGHIATITNGCCWL